VPSGASTAQGSRINFEGILKTSNADPRATQHRAYVQLYRSGIVASGVKLNFVRGSPTWSDDISDPLDRDQYHFDEVIFETIPADQEECASIIRPILDQAANAGGRATSPIFDAQGRYIRLKNP
jgi:hypothetical protein